MARIETIGVCGAGVMGSQLAALFASAGLRVHLLDLNQELSEKGLAGAVKAKPAAFYLKKFAKSVTPGNYEEHLERVAECDWVIEAIAERLEWKRELYGRLSRFLGPEALLTSNTSGLYSWDGNPQTAYHTGPYVNVVDSCGGAAGTG